MNNGNGQKVIGAGSLEPSAQANAEPSLEARLEAVRARRAEMAEAAQARLDPTPEELLAREERGLAEDEAYAAAQEQHGARFVRMVTTDDGAVILRRPHIAAFRKFQDAGEASSERTEELVLSCLLYPSKPDFHKLMKLQPGALVRLASVCVEMAGFRAQELRAK